MITFHRFVAAILMMVTIIPMAFCECARRSFPTNFVFLFIFTVAQGFFLGVVSAMYDKDSVLIAIGITLVVCMAMTLFSFQTKFDFTGWSGALLAISIVLTVTGVILFSFPGDKFRVIYGSFGALIFSLYLIADTQYLTGGNHKYSISPEEYVFAALNIYLDIINIFLNILMMMDKKK